MKETKTFYKFEIEGTSLFFDDEICYNFNDQKITDLNLFHFKFPKMDFCLFITNGCHIFYSNGQPLTNFLKDKGVIYKLYNGISYQFLKPTSERVKILMKNGENIEIMVRGNEASRYIGLFDSKTSKYIYKYTLSEKARFHKSIPKTIINTENYEVNKNEYPEELRQFLKKRKQQENLFMLKVAIIIILAILFYTYAL